MQTCTHKYIHVNMNVLTHGQSINRHSTLQTKGRKLINKSIISLHLLRNILISLLLCTRASLLWDSSKLSHCSALSIFLSSSVIFTLVVEEEAEVHMGSMTESKRHTSSTTFLVQARISRPVGDKVITQHCCHGNNNSKS